MAPFQDILHYVTSNYPEDQLQFNSSLKASSTHPLTRISMERIPSSSKYN